MKEGTKKFLTCIFLLLMSFSVVVAPFFGVEKVNAEEGGSWTTLAPLPTRTWYYTGTAALNNKIYYIESNRTMRYDPETNNWTQLASLPILNYWGTVVAYQNKIYVLSGNASKPTQVYDPTIDTWENKSSIPATRIETKANVVDGKIYVISGQQLAGLGIINPSSSNYVYDPETDSWSQMAPIPTPVTGYASAMFENKIYIISGGHEGGPDYEPINLVQIFDPATNQWTNGTSIPTAVYAARACVITGPSASKQICVIGGQLTYYFQDAADGVNLNQVYDPATDTWTTGTSMPTSRSDFGAAVVNDEIYAIGGQSDGTYLTANEKYSPTDSIPEFPSWVVLPLFLVATSLVVVVRNRIFRSSSQ